MTWCHTSGSPGRCARAVHVRGVRDSTLAVRAGRCAPGRRGAGLCLHAQAVGAVRAAGCATDLMSGACDSAHMQCCDTMNYHVW